MPATQATLESSERDQISRFRYWHDYINYDDNLVELASREAGRMADLGRLDPPQLPLPNTTGVNYVGHSKRITGLFSKIYKTLNILF